MDYFRCEVDSLVGAYAPRSVKRYLVRGPQTRFTAFGDPRLPGRVFPGGQARP